jgi:hypothetical protein
MDPPRGPTLILHTQSCWVSGFCLSSGILIARQYNVSEKSKRGGPSALGLGVGLTILHRGEKNMHYVEPRTWKDSLDKRPKLI